MYFSIRLSQRQDVIFHTLSQRQDVLFHTFITKTIRTFPCVHHEDKRFFRNVAHFFTIHLCPVSKDVKSVGQLLFWYYLGFAGYTIFTYTSTVLWIDQIYVITTPKVAFFIFKNWVFVIKIQLFLINLYKDSLSALASGLFAVGNCRQFIYIVRWVIWLYSLLICRLIDDVNNKYGTVSYLM